MCPVSEKFGVARVKLAYIIDSMGCNLASMSPICSYGPYITGLDVGPMYIAEQRAIKTGRLIGPNDTPIVIESKDETELPPEAKVTLANFLIPLGVLFATIIAMILYTGDIAHNSLMDTFLNSSITTCIITGMCTGSIACAIMAHKAKVFKLSEAMERFIKGVVETSSFPPALVPAVVFLAGAFVAFSTGSSWGTWAIMIPIAVPIAVQFDFPIPLAIAGAIGGGLFGDQCSPISDTTILASTASGSDHVRHAAAG